MTVRYDPEQPSRARLDAGYDLATFGMPLLLLGGGASFVGIGLLALRSGRLQLAAEGAPTEKARRAAARKDARIVASFVLAVGAGLAVAGLAVLPSALAQRSWPRLTARVERADVYARSSSSPRPGKGSPTPHYVVRIFLTYEHEGRTYAAPLDAGSSRSREESEQRAAAIPKGQPRDILVNPKRPNRIARVDSWPLVLPAAFLLSGLAVVAVAVRLLRR